VDERDAWMRQILQEMAQGRWVGAAWQLASRAGVPPRRASQLVEEAAQQALTQMLERCGEGYFKGYDHFCRWVRLATRDRLSDVLEREQRQSRLGSIDDRQEQPRREIDPATEAALRQLLPRLPQADLALLSHRFVQRRTLTQLANEYFGGRVSPSWVHRRIKVAARELVGRLMEAGFEYPEEVRYALARLLRGASAPASNGRRAGSADPSEQVGADGHE
jgi:hypothetical protein